MYGEEHTEVRGQNFQWLPVHVWHNEASPWPPHTEPMPRHSIRKKNVCIVEVLKSGVKEIRVGVGE